MTERHPFPKLLDHYQHYVQFEKGLSSHTLAAYRRDLEDFARFSADYSEESLELSGFCALEIRHFRAWLSARLSRGLSASATARAVSSLRGFNNFLRKRYGRYNAELEDLQTPKKPSRLPRPLQEGQSLRLLQAALKHKDLWQGRRDAALCTLLWGTGLRIAEALAIRHTDLERRDGMLRVLGKGEKWRTVPLLPVVRSAIAEYLEVCPYPVPPEEVIFRAARGGALSPRHAQSLLQRLRRSLGLDESVTPHALRHSFASDLLKHGGDLRTIQELLGHASLSSTQRYTEIDRATLAQVYRKAHREP